MTNNSSVCFCKKLARFFRGKDFNERSLKSQEKFAESAMKLSEIIAFGSFVWLKALYWKI